MKDELIFIVYLRWVRVAGALSIDFYLNFVIFGCVHPQM
jgi:hypothetical protein